MTKIGRNQPCVCGSGKKFKHCHGKLSSAASEAAENQGLPSQADFQAAKKQHEAMEFQRVRQQGYGKPIISCELNGVRFVAIGSRIAYGKWQVFPDFLMHYLKDTFGRAWGQIEMEKPEADRHPLFHWLAALQLLMQAHTSNSTGINTMPEYGAARAIYGLAYDLYVIDHHAQSDLDKLTVQRLVARLKHPEQFFGARHEARVAGMLLRAGFNLKWEDEQERREGGHAEFIATFPQTGRSFWVECRMRQSENDEDGTRFERLVSGALRKKTDLERLVFVELNLLHGHLDAEQDGWPRDAINRLRILERQPNAIDLPQAFVMISNFSEHRQLDRVPEGCGALLEGFKTELYRFGATVDLQDAIEERQKNPEIECLWRSMREHGHIPTTFDGSIYGLDESHRLIIGRSYQLSDGVIGVLEEATVVEQWRRAAAVFRLPSEERVIVYADLSDSELDAWRRHPETFFGTFRDHHPPAKNLMDMFDFFAKGFAKTPKNRLLELMAHHDDIERLRTLSQPELVKNYAYGLTVTLAQQGKGPDAPGWYQHLRPPRKPT